MARVKIDLPNKFTFSTEIPVRIGDVNYGGHVGNDAILSIAHDSRLLFLKHFGYSELELEGVSMIMADSAVVYKGEAFFGDIVKVEVTAADFHKFGFDLVYKMTNSENGKDIAHLKTGMLCFNYEVRKLALLPEAAKNKLQND